MLPSAFRKVWCMTRTPKACDDDGHLTNMGIMFLERVYACE